MFAQKLRVDVVIHNLTGQAEFDDTFPVADGLLEAGFRVHPKRLAEAMSGWVTQRGKGQGRPVRIEIRLT